MFNLHIMRKVVVKSETYTIKNCFATAVSNTTRDNMSVKKVQANKPFESDTTLSAQNRAVSCWCCKKIYIIILTYSSLIKTFQTNFWENRRTANIYSFLFLTALVSCPGDYYYYQTASFSTNKTTVSDKKGLDTKITLLLNI